MKWPSLKSTQVLGARQRNSAIDLFRGLAIVSVVLFHFGAWEYGFLGVDLFFVISGFLVGGVLIEMLYSGERISYGRFVLSRGCKIWPSYFAFLLVGAGIARLVYGGSHPGEIIPWAEWPRYLFFYRNYRGGSHWTFDHIWSLCVEEHFYLLLPLAFLVAQRAKKRKERLLAFLVAGMLLFGLLAKIGGRLIHFETYCATHNCIDALAWGTLLRLGLKSGRLKPPRGAGRALALSASGALLCAAVLVHHSHAFPLFNEVFFSSVVPPFFALAILGCIEWDFSRARALRYLAYYSYNWYLWHPLLIVFLRDRIASIPLQFAVYVVVSLAFAVVFTVLVEEPVLAHRRRILGWVSGAAYQERLPQAPEASLGQ